MELNVSCIPGENSIHADWLVHLNKVTYFHVVFIDLIWISLFTFMIVLSDIFYGNCYDFCIVGTTNTNWLWMFLFICYKWRISCSTKLAVHIALDSIFSLFRKFTWVVSVQCSEDMFTFLCLVDSANGDLIKFMSGTLFYYFHCILLKKILYANSKYPDQMLVTSVWIPGISGVNKCSICYISVFHIFCCYNFFI